MRPSSTTAIKRERRRVSALIAALTPLLILILIQPATVLAKPPTGTVTVIDGKTGEQTIVDDEPEVCTFAVIFDFDQAFPIVGWKIKDWVPGNWKDGETRLKDQGATDDDGLMRIPDSGFFTLPEGRYNVVADDESPIDGSSKVQSFHVVCLATTEPTPTPTSTPPDATPTTPTSTPSDDGEEQPATGTPSSSASDSGEVEAAVGTPRITLPPTDAGIGSPMTSRDAWIAILGLGAFAFVIVLLTPRHLRRDRRR